MNVRLDQHTYSLLLEHKQSSLFHDQPGQLEDLAFLEEDLWLQDTVVFDWVSRLAGTWQIFLVFVYHEDPFLLIMRYIKSQISESKAKMEGSYLRRSAAKDQRGNLELNEGKFRLCQN